MILTIPALVSRLAIISNVSVKSSPTYLKLRTVGTLVDLLEGTIFGRQTRKTSLEASGFECEERETLWGKACWILGRVRRCDAGEDEGDGKEQGVVRESEVVR